MLEKRFLEKRAGAGVLDSPEDKRDYQYQAEKVFPSSYLNTYPILNQTFFGTCVPHAIVTAMVASLKAKDPSVNHNVYSRAFIYGYRLDEDYQGEGMITRQALRCVNHYGTPSYYESPFNRNYPKTREKILSQIETENLLEKAEPHRVAAYYRLYTTEEIKTAVISEGSAICTMPLYKGFGKYTQLPAEGEKSKGSHAMVIVGWTKDNHWIVQNSWGTLWGEGGRCYVPFDYPFKEYWAVSVEAAPKMSKPNLLTRAIAAIRRLLHV